MSKNHDMSYTFNCPLIMKLNELSSDGLFLLIRQRHNNIDLEREEQSN